MSEEGPATWRELAALSMLMFLGTFVGVLIDSVVHSFLIALIFLIPGCIILMIGAYENWEMIVRVVKETKQQ